MRSVGRITIHRDRAILETPHRRFFGRALCKATIRAISNTLGMEISATASATATVAGAIFLAASSADLEGSTTSSHQPMETLNAATYVAAFCLFRIPRVVWARFSRVVKHR